MGFLTNYADWWIDTTTPTDALGNNAGSSGGSATWNTLYLNGTAVPGVAEVTCDIDNIYEEITAQGTVGQKVTYKGRKAKLLKARIKIVSQDDYNSFQDFIKSSAAFLDVAGKPTAPVTVDHPQAQIAGITQVFLHKLHLPAPNAKDPWIPELDMIEQIVPLPAVAGPPPPATLGQSLVPPQPGISSGAGPAP